MKNKQTQQKNGQTDLDTPAGHLDAVIRDARKDLKKARARVTEIESAIANLCKLKRERRINTVSLGEQP